MILPTLVPTPIDEQSAINRVAVWVATVHHKLDMRRDEVHAELERLLRERLRSGRTDREKVIEAANNGCKLSHEILIAEFHDLLDVDAMPPANLRAYAARADENRVQARQAVVRRFHPQHRHLHAHRCSRAGIRSQADAQPRITARRSPVGL